MQNLIGEKWMDSVSKKTTNVVNPATGENKIYDNLFQIQNE